MYYLVFFVAHVAPRENKINRHSEGPRFTGLDGLDPIVDGLEFCGDLNVLREIVHVTLSWIAGDRTIEIRNLLVQLGTTGRSGRRRRR
jgi:hypothetical protein